MSWGNGMYNMGESMKQFTVDANTLIKNVNKLINTHSGMHKKFTQLLTTNVHNFTDYLSQKAGLYPVSTSTSITTPTYIYKNYIRIGGVQI